GSSASALSNYVYAIGGDGFEVIWNNKASNKILGSIYNGDLQRSLNGSLSWQSATSGFTPGDKFPFVTKLASSKDFPDRVFTVSTDGVYKSSDFGGTWSLTAIPQDFVISTSTYLDV